MTTWHEHSFFAKLDMLTADCACWWFKVLLGLACSQTTRCHFILLAMFFFYFYHRQLLHSLRLSFILFPIPFSFLFRYSTNHFKYVISWIETAFIILHEITWVCAIKSRLHSQELMTWEEHLECCQHWIDWTSQSLYMLVDLFLFFCCWYITTKSFTRFSGSALTTYLNLNPASAWLSSLVWTLISLSRLWPPEIDNELRSWRNF